MERLPITERVRLMLIGGGFSYMVDDAVELTTNQHKFYESVKNNLLMHFNDEEASNIALYRALTHRNFIKQLEVSSIITDVQVPHVIAPEAYAPVQQQPHLVNPQGDLLPPVEAENSIPKADAELERAVVELAEVSGLQMLSYRLDELEPLLTLAWRILVIGLLVAHGWFHSW